MDFGEGRAKLKEIQENARGSLQSAIDSLAVLREEGREFLLEIHDRQEKISRELKTAREESQKTEKNYNHSRLILLEVAKSGDEAKEKEAYEEAMDLMKLKGVLEERIKMLSARREFLSQEESRMARILARSEEMANRFRVVLNLLDFSLDEEAPPLRPEEAEFAAGLRLAERESASLARDLHDGPIQKFSATGLMLDLAGEYLARGDFEKTREEIKKTRAHISDALDDFRSFLFQLNPAGLKAGFETPLKRLCSQLKALSGVEAGYSVKGRVDLVPLSVRTSVFKIIHQAAGNAVKNGRAKGIKIDLVIEQGFLRAGVADDGVGFDVKKARAQAEEKGSWGLAIMEERASQIGGKLTIESEPGRGTMVALAVPL